MTRKDYKAIAESIAAARKWTGKAGERGIEQVVHELCRTLAKDNPRFDERRFREACGQ